MKVLIVGSGAKEYTLAKLISYYENTSLVFVAPGNDAISEFANCIDIKADDTNTLVEFAKANEIDLTIVCSETAINEGIAEKFNEEGLMIFAPTQEAGKIAQYKSIGKKFMYKSKISTPKFGIFERENLAIDYARKSKYPLVVKTDMHMHGENVFICDNFKIAKRVIENMFDNKHKKVVIEDFVQGQEFSYYVITDGYNAMPLSSVVPYKGSKEGNGGVITSGLGAYAPSYMINSAIEREIFKGIVYPALDELAKNGNQYIGILGIDLIIDREGKLNVIEFNSFLKEPDAQCVLELLDTNLLNLFKAAIVGSLVDDYNEIPIKPLFSTSVVLNSGNYPSEGQYGCPIAGTEEAEEQCNIAHFNTFKNNENNFCTSGGRTLTVTTNASTLEFAAKKMYECVDIIEFESKKYRKDIGKTILIGY